MCINFQIQLKFRMLTPPLSFQGVEAPSQPADPALPDPNHARPDPQGEDFFFGGFLVAFR